MIILKSKKCDFTVFSIGAVGYCLLEVIWRGYTHWSMLFAGGTSFLGLSKISSVFKKAGIVKKALVGSALITAVEYIYGIIFNVILKRKVWDYSNLPLNIGGQVCALYTFFWFLLSLVFIPLADRLKKKLR